MKTFDWTQFSERHKPAWAAWLEANHQHTRFSYRLQGVLPQLAKEAMHVAVSMTNHCNY